MNTATTYNSNGARAMLLINEKPCVLLVDDSAPTLRLISRALQHEGVKVNTASNGFTALQMMKCNLYTVVIMDVQMPIMDGIESIRQLREWESSSEADGKHQYIITASANVEDSARDEAVAVGTDNFIVKPIEFTKLIEIVSSIHGLL